MPDDEMRTWIAERTAVLESATAPEELEVAAAELALSDHPEALDALGGFLRRGEFLARLDDVTDPGEKTTHLGVVLTPLIERPSPDVERVCLALAEDPAFLADDDRKAFLLQALAGVRPMRAETVAVFRASNAEGYFAFNAPLLVANGSPGALELFRDMMADREAPEERRVDCLHASVLPERARLTTLVMVDTLLGDDLEAPVATAAIEAVFDFNWRWFGTRPPTRPAWRSAPDEVLQFLIGLGERAKRRTDLPDRLREAIDATLETAGALLRRRAA